MADKLGLGREVRELKLGTSFTNPNTGFHTLRYDFKPASVDINKMATVDVGANNQVTLTIPPNTVFKGSSKPYQKQCIVIVNRDTREITLEKLSCNIQVKKTRSESKKVNVAPSLVALDHFAAKNKKAGSGLNKSIAANKNISHKNDVKAKNKPHMLAASLGTVVPKHSPLHASPNRKSPNPVGVSPSRQSTSASLPVIGFEDSFVEDTYPSNHVTKERSVPVHSKKELPKKDYRTQPTKHEHDTKMNVEKSAPNFDDVGILSDSSTSSSGGSSSSSDSSDSSDSEASKKKGKPAPTQHNTSLPAMPDHLLNEDLQLSSESGSESD